MLLASPLRIAAAIAAAVVSLTTLAATPALAAPKTKASVVFGSTPANPSQARTATFTWSSTPPGAVFTCSLDGAVGTSCASGISLSGLSDGSHRFTVRAKAPGYRPGTATYSWQVAATPPGAPTIVAVPSPTKSQSATISFSNSDPNAYSHSCALDGATAEPCTSPLIVAGPLGDGSHTVVVTARDAYGFSGGSSSVSWVIDATAPGNVAISAPASPTNQTSFSITFSQPDATHFTCALDDAAAAACVSPYVTGTVAEGLHRLTVVAADEAGNIGQPATAVWEVDTTAPATPSISTGPADPTNQTAASFVLSGVESSSRLSCQLDNLGWATCPQPLGYASLASGAHSFRVRATDTAGNSSGEASHLWTVDTTQPAPASFIDGPASPSNSTSVVFDFAETDPGTIDSFSCSLDGGAYSTCDGSEVVTVTGDGVHVYAVRARNTAGTESAAALWQWVLDTQAPTAPVFSTTPDATTTSTSALFSFASEPGTSFTCSVDGAAPTSCASPVTLTSVSLGSHSFTVTAQDAARNTSQSRFDWTVNAPVVVPPTDPTAPTSPTTPSTPSTPPAPPAPSAAGSAATTTTVTANPALRGVSTVAFSSPVRGISATTVRLQAVGSAATTAVGLTCKDTAGAAVDCATGDVRTVAVQPNVALIPGQAYTLSVSGLLDTAGAAVATASAGFRASTSEQESSLRAGFAWRKAKSARAYGRSYVTEQRAGATVTVPFSGTKVSWFTMTGPTQGVATVYVDGVKKARVNNYSATTTWRVTRTVKGLRPGAHQLRIVVAGVKGAKAGKGTSIVFDAVSNGTALVATPKSVTTWRTAKATTASGAAFAAANLRGATTSFTFRGTSVSWFTQTSPAMGKAKVYVDGVLKTTVDNYSKRSIWNVRRTVSGLSDATHTVTVKVTGSKRKASTGTEVVVDRWLVG